MAESNRRSRSVSLAALVRRIAYETRQPGPDEPITDFETRLESALRSLWERARTDPTAFKALADRGWGHVPMPVTVTLIGAGLIEHAKNLGIGPDHVLADPTLKSLFADGGVEVIDGEFRIVRVDEVR